MAESNTRNRQLTTAEQIDTLYQERLAYISRINKGLEIAENGSDEDYRNSLIDAYKDFRKLDYELTVRNECIRTYTDCKDLKFQGKGPMSQTNKSTYANAKLPQDSIPRQLPLLANQSLNGRDNDNFHTELNTCSLTAAAIAQSVSDKMGYTDEHNLIIITQRDKSCHFKSNNVCDARGIAYLDSFPKDCCLETNEQKTPRDLIADGQLHTGDIITVKTARGATNTSTGYHALTIADIDKDANGQVTAYTLHANNGAMLETYDINDKNPKYFGNRPLKVTAQCNQWMDNQIEQEIQNMQNLPIDELKLKVEESSTHIHNTIEQLHQTEKNNHQKGYSQGIKSSYATQIEETVRLAKNQKVQHFNSEFDFTEAIVPTTDFNSADNLKHILKEQNLNRISQSQSINKQETQQAEENQTPSANNTNIVDFSVLDAETDEFSYNPNKEAEVKAQGVSKSASTIAWQMMQNRSR